jgi:uncharacterized protein (DUF1330 family)
VPNAYVICYVNVTDTEAYEEYRRLAGIAADKFGLRFLARGGRTEVLEGDQDPQRVVIIEFPDAGTARAWYTSAEYTAARQARANAATANFVLVEGS